MVLKDTLNPEMIVAGQALIQRLDAEKKEIPAALWLYLTEPNEWRLILATPIVNAKGPRAAYKMIRSVLVRYKDEFPSLDLQDIGVVAPDDPVLKPFGFALKISGTSGVRFSRNTVAGEFIEDAYVYRVT